MTRGRRRPTVQGPVRNAVRKHAVPGQSDVVHTHMSSSNPRRASSTATRTLGAAPPAKKKKTALAEPSGKSPLQPMASKVTPPTHEDCFQGSSVHMRMLLESEELFVRGFVRRHWHQDIEPPRACPRCLDSPPARSSHRCIDCWDSDMLCAPCLVAAHTHLPFHRTESWTGAFFKRAPLGELGLVLHLSHGPRECPQRPPSEDPTEMTIVDISGVHSLGVRYCHCRGCLPPVEQLLQHRLWPATTKNPTTAFSFALLNDYHHHTLTSRKSALDYWKTVCRKTSNGFPERVPNRYTQLLRTSRFYRYIRSLERSGQPFQMDAHLRTAHRDGLIAVPCFGCPEPEFNMPDDWRETPASLSHIHRAFKSMDANFANQKKIKNKSDPDDFALFKGRCYFPPEEEFQQYLSQVTDTLEKSECSDHKAVNLQNILKFKHMSVTGLIAVVCKHDCFSPGGHNDLQRGERFANGDYAMSQSMTWVPAPNEVAWSYDVMCQFIIKIRERWKRHFASSMPLLDRVIAAIPKKHLPGHKENCKIRYSCNHLPGFGRFYGEGIEAVWAEDNQQRGSLREMNNGHRHDVTDDNHLDWNNRKNQKMACSTYENFMKALEEYNNAVIEYDAASEVATPMLVSQWLKADPSPQELSPGVWTSVYKTQRDKAPTQAQIYQKLMRREISTEIINLGPANPTSTDPPAAISASPVAGAAQFIWAGLQIEKHQLEIQERSSRATSNTDVREHEYLETARLKLQRDLAKWRQHQMTRLPAFPLALSRLAKVDPEDPELHPLGLPSDFPDSGTRRELGLDTLVQIEIELREGQANDALEALREDIRTEFCLKGHKTVHARGTGATTRAQNLLQSAARKKMRSADIYIRARAAMIALGKSSHDPSFSTRFPALDKKQDLWMRDPTEIHTLGDGTRHEPWIWQVGLQQQGEGASAWRKETDRVRWFKSRAAMQRFREEIQIRDADFSRIHRAYTRMAAAWESIATYNTTDGARDGATQARVAYAHKMSYYNSARAAECQDLYREAKQSPLAKETVLDSPV